MKIILILILLFFDLFSMETDNNSSKIEKVILQNIKILKGNEYFVIPSFYDLNLNSKIVKILDKEIDILELEFFNTPKYNKQYYINLSLENKKYFEINKIYYIELKNNEIISIYK